MPDAEGTSVPEVMLQTLQDRGRFLEDHALSVGRERFQKQVREANDRGSSSSAGGVMHLLRDGITPTQNAMQAALDASGKKRGVKHIAEKIIPLIGADTAAFITLRLLLDGILKKHQIPLVASLICESIRDELRFRKFRAEAPGLFNFKMDGFTTTHYTHKKKSLLHTAKHAGVNFDDDYLTDSQRIALGVWCINMCIQATNLLSIQNQQTMTKGGKKRVTIKVLVAEPETLEWLDTRTGAMELLWPVAMPMVEPPLPWGLGQRGGYRYALRNKYHLCRGANSKQTSKLVDTQYMPVVYKAVNALQNTAWQINHGVAVVLQEIVTRGGGLAKVPSLHLQELPLRPDTHPEFELQRKVRRRQQKKHPEMPLPDMSPEMAVYLKGWKAWKKKAGIIKSNNAEKRVQRIAMNRLMRLVDTLSPDPELYFVYNLDFRGRVYPVVGGLLSPQGNDLAKALLTFAHPRPLGVSGRRFLAQHGASKLDTVGDLKFSQMAIEQRVQWVEDNSLRIQQVAQDPWGHRWWMEADKPLQFLAFCQEWSRMCQWVQAGNHEDTFLSGLPCSQDGSCNGIQHFSAMLRDKVGGEAVNLVPLSTPQDIYSRVLAKVLTSLEQDSNGNDLAMKWLTSGLVTRKAVKRNVMTFPYGSRTYGFSLQLQEYLRGQAKDDPEESRALWKKTREHFLPPALGNRQGQDAKVVAEACRYLAGLIMKALEQTVVAASQAMRWMKDSASVIGQTKQCLEWVVPGTGFLVRQEYMQVKHRRVETVLLGSMYKPRITTQTGVPHRAKQASAIAPNIVHSLDAAALMLTVTRSVDNGVQSFAMVHDSYGAPAGDCEVLAWDTRAAFIQMYTEHDVVASLSQSFQDKMPPVDPTSTKAPLVLPAPPQLGDLDLSQVYACDFFFQ